jgi:hypothetical protein
MNGRQWSAMPAVVAHLHGSTTDSLETPLVLLERALERENPNKRALHVSYKRLREVTTTTTHHHDDHAS